MIVIDSFIYIFLVLLVPGTVAAIVSRLILQKNFDRQRIVFCWIIGPLAGVTSLCAMVLLNSALPLTFSPFLYFFGIEIALPIGAIGALLGTGSGVKLSRPY